MAARVLALVSVGLLAACSTSSSDSRALSNNPAAMTSAAASSSPGAGTALRQWGSLVARIEAPVRKAVQAFANCGPLDYGQSAPLECAIGRLTIDFATQAFSENFTSGGAAIAPAPAELSSLVGATRTDAKAVHAADQPVRKECGAVVTSPCTAAREAFIQAVDQFTADLDGWTPYTGS